jgi:hypothetical protein
MNVRKCASKVSKLTPSELADSPTARLVAQKGATIPRVDLLSLALRPGLSSTEGPPSRDVLCKLREERL